MSRRDFYPQERLELYLRAGGKCQKCGKELHGKFHADHIVPFSEGGETTLSNGQALCVACNHKKGPHYSCGRSIRLTIKLDAELYQALQALRAETGVSVTESLRRAVREYVASQRRINALVREYRQDEDQNED